MDQIDYETTIKIDESTSNSQGKLKNDQNWTKVEEDLFNQGIQTVGKDFNQIKKLYVNFNFQKKQGNS